MRMNPAVPWAFAEHNSGITGSDFRNFQHFPYTYGMIVVFSLVVHVRLVMQNLRNVATGSLRLISSRFP